MNWERRPDDDSERRPNVHAPTTIPAGADRRRRCTFLVPRHLTGCRRDAEPGSRFCAERQDGDGGRCAPGGAP